MSGVLYSGHLHAQTSKSTLRFGLKELAHKKAKEENLQLQA